MEREKWNITRSNLRKRAVKRVTQFMKSLNDEDMDCTNEEHSVENEVVTSSFVLPPICRSESDGESESASDEDSLDITKDLAGCLRDWATHFRISLIALSALLSILKVHHPSLPKDARTLLKTQTQHSVVSLASGSFHYFGIQKMFSHIFQKLTSVVRNHHSFKLQLNMDGLPIFKSSGVQFWPILGMLQAYSRKPVLIALYCGKSKPQSLSEYLKDLVCELKSLSTGFVVNGKTFFLTVCSVICDAPARAFIKGIKSHNGYSGCDKCVQSGIYINNRMTFPELNSRVRTDVSFSNAEDEDHHVQHSPFCETSVPMVSGFPHDYMHLVCLGVVRRLLDLWMGTRGKLSYRISSRQVSIISGKLLALKSYIPSEFARRPRALDERLRWKATELRQFLLYTGPVVLRDVLTTEVYQNFMLLSVGIYILASPTYCLLLNDFANTLLRSFVKHFGELYGHCFLVYNIHGLTHLSDDVKVHGHLDLISGFPFENYLKKIKGMVRKPSSPLQQVIRRISELDSTSLNDEETRKAHKKMKMLHSDGPVPEGFTGAVSQFKELSIDEVVINTSERDRCIKMNNKILLVQNIIVFEGEEYIVCKEYRHIAKFFDYPIESTDLGICFVSDLSPKLMCLTLDTNMQKCVRLPLEVGFVVIPLLHADPS
ncbi:uncharacterized protein LOC131540562 [Onychostoma macrolepis]|uniref:uncharacterized protein LOC131540562 n=1 Tax=Onychostoma macrolepis TaxID=369639 RepID=UPI00272B211A|nr:uncharacterized protein LOC131540562 [Onychostoma macrolepis]